ncbi:hypothetical protein LOD99_1697 [Oopsacas minuta]|uniref:TRAF1-6 MATH domain-containing protein n=1 Tax=Oopsacas minuta TaxID=111878 RepID=A0AAV7K401_9METZ|nr:hypothetical protein LOD99_1697 [Oopsacas minuta]
MESWYADKVGVFICIMNGACNDKLHWPIKYKSTFILFNQINNQNNFVHANVVTNLDKYSESLKRPTELRNKGLGTGSFILCTEILEEKYNKEDSITLQIRVELLPLL